MMSRRSLGAVNALSCLNFLRGENPCAFETRSLAAAWGLTKGRGHAPSGVLKPPTPLILNIPKMFTRYHNVNIQY